MGRGGVYGYEGYPDLTSYKVLMNIQRAEYGYRPLTDICSPHSGDTDARSALARRVCARAVGVKKIPIAPHLLFPQFMNDTDSDERELAMVFNRVILSRRESMWVYTPKVSPGMRVEIGRAYALELPIRYIDAEFTEVTL